MIFCFGCGARSAFVNPAAIMLYTIIVVFVLCFCGFSVNFSTLTVCLLIFNKENELQFGRTGNDPLNSYKTKTGLLPAGKMRT